MSSVIFPAGRMGRECGQECPLRSGSAAKLVSKRAETAGRLVFSALEQEIFFPRRIDWWEERGREQWQTGWICGVAEA